MRTRLGVDPARSYENPLRDLHDLVWQEAPFYFAPRRLGKALSSIPMWRAPWKLSAALARV